MVATNSANHHATLLECAQWWHATTVSQCCWRTASHQAAWLGFASICWSPWRRRRRRWARCGSTAGQGRARRRTAEAASTAQLLRLQLPGVDAQPGRARQTEAARAAMRLGQLERRPRGTRRRHLRSSNLPIQNTRCSTHTYHSLGDRSFVVAGPRVWNSVYRLL